MVETVREVVSPALDTYMEYGVLGATLLVFFIMSAILLFLLIKDRDNNKRFSESLKAFVENQSHALDLQERAEKHNRELIKIISEVNQIERGHTQNCYKTLDEKISKILLIIDSKQVHGVNV